MGMGMGAAALLALGTLGSGAMGAFGSSGDEMSDEQRNLINQQVELMQQQTARQAAYTPQYTETLGQLGPLIRQKMTATELPEDLAQAIGKYYGQAGEQLGIYGAGRGMLDSGPMNRMYGQLAQDKAAQQLSTLLGERRSGEQMGMSLLGLNPGGSIPSISLPSQRQPGVDWGSIGSLFAKGFSGQQPQAQNYFTGLTYPQTMAYVEGEDVPQGTLAYGY